jgi:hypothetical protein
MVRAVRYQTEFSKSEIPEREELSPERFFRGGLRAIYTDN